MLFPDKPWSCARLFFIRSYSLMSLWIVSADLLCWLGLIQSCSLSLMPSLNFLSYWLNVEASWARSIVKGSFILWMSARLKLKGRSCLEMASVGWRCGVIEEMASSILVRLFSTKGKAFSTSNYNIYWCYKLVASIILFANYLEFLLLANRL